MTSSVDDIKLIENQVIESRGNNIFVYEPANYFFEIKRIFTISGKNIQTANRGFHAHRTDFQITFGVKQNTLKKIQWWLFIHQVNMMSEVILEIITSFCR